MSVRVVDAQKVLEELAARQRQLRERLKEASTTLPIIKQAKREARELRSLAARHQQLVDEQRRLEEELERARREKDRVEERRRRAEERLRRLEEELVGGAPEGGSATEGGGSSPLPTGGKHYPV